MLGKIYGDNVMKVFKNLFAGDLMYQDLGDCSLGYPPLIRELVVEQDGIDVLEDSDNDKVA